MSRKERTIIEVGKAMNCISEDLKFTTESEEDFVKKRLPTLSFEMWSERTGLRHSYFEKGMRSQIMTMKRSSQSEQSKVSILVNELTRRFEVLDARIDIKEKVDIINHYTQQLLNSGYLQDQIRDIMISGLKGIHRKEERRKAALTRYKSSLDTLEERERKKLMEATNWYKKKNVNVEEEDNFKLVSLQENINWSKYKKGNKKGGKRKDPKSVEVNGKEKVTSVIFVPHTERSELAKNIKIK